jgi:general secretion pathway protein C
MQNIRYHLVNSGSVVVFAFVFALTLNSVVRFSLSPSTPPSLISSFSSAPKEAEKKAVDYNAIINSNFFKLASTDSPVAAVQASDMSEFILLGTITGPASFSRALIKKRTDPDSKIYPLWSDVFGYKLVRIDNTKVYLKTGDKVNELELYVKTPVPGTPAQATQTSPNRIKQTLSRSEMQQKIQNNMDTMLQGLRAGPYLVNGKIDGFKLFEVAPTNFLYTIGARSGDVIKRINGHPIDSTEKLYNIWLNLNKESRVTLDIDRNNSTVTYDYTFSD